MSLELRVHEAALRELVDAIDGYAHYRISYVVDSDVLQVIAIAHERRMPQYWAGRGAPGS